MAIAFNSVGTGINNNNDGTIQSTHTILSSSNSIVILYAGINNTSKLNDFPTFAGTPMTKLLTGTQTSTSFAYEMWYLLNPPIGVNTLQGTFATASTDKNNVTVMYDGVNQTTPFAGSTFLIGTSLSSGSITLTITAGNLFAGGYYMSSPPPGTTNIGDERGTAGSSSGHENIGADSAGTLRWTHFSRNVISLGGELVAAGGVTASVGISNRMLGRIGI